MYAYIHAHLCLLVGAKYVHNDVSVPKLIIIIVPLNLANKYRHGRCMMVTENKGRGCIIMV